MKPYLLLLPGLAFAVTSFAQRVPTPLVDGRAQGVVRVPTASVWGTSLPGTTSRRGPLYVVNGRILPDSVETPLAEDIISLRELEPDQAVARYGPRAAHGALLIETRKRKGSKF